MANVENHKYALDPFQCKCILCITFWKNVFGSSADVLFDSYKRRMEESSDLGIRIKDMIKVGDRVSVHGKNGIVKYVGFVDDNSYAPKVHVGVKLDENVQSLTNGIYEGKRYFYCTPGHGIMVPYREVKRLRPFVKTPHLHNTMFPSYNQVCRARKERKEKLEAFYRSRSSSPRLYDTQRTFIIGNPPTRVITSDVNDMAYKDRLRMNADNGKQEKNEKLRQEKSRTEEKRALMKLFGSGERAEKLGKTLKYLQNGYEKGQIEKAKSQRQYNNYETDEE